MPRKGPVPRREVLADPVYNNKLVTRFINKLMLKGKKSLSERIFYTAMDLVSKRTGKDPLTVFNQALDNVMPVVEVRPAAWGATYQVPVEVRPERRISLGMRWLVTSARARSGKSMIEKLAAELIDASSGAGAAVKKREDTHRMAEANKAFAHYRW